MAAISSDELNKAYLNSLAIEWRHLMDMNGKLVLTNRESDQVAMYTFEP